MRAVLTIRGKSSEWGIIANLGQDQVEAMRADGIEIGELMHTVPEWAVSVGLLRPWCFAQDVWNFRWPFHSR